MAGCRPLTNEEEDKIFQHLKKKDLRSAVLFHLGMTTGFRISELLSLQIEDISGKDEILVQRKHMKNKQTRMAIPLKKTTKKLLKDFIDSLPKNATNLFLSRNGNNKPISRMQAHEILKNAFFECEVDGKVATHSMRKTFAKRLWDKTKDIDLVRIALGHRWISTTQTYLGTEETEVKKLILEL
jgi:site-specific recombinase XerD